MTGELGVAVVLGFDSGQPVEAVAIPKVSDDCPKASCAPLTVMAVATLPVLRWFCAEIYKNVSVVMMNSFDQGTVTVP